MLYECVYVSVRTVQRRMTPYIASNRINLLPPFFVVVVVFVAGRSSASGIHSYMILIKESISLFLQFYSNRLLSGDSRSEFM